MLDFTIGLTEGVAWPWPIAVYLFLAGISGGAVAVAICVNLFRGVHLNTPIMKAASLIGIIYSVIAFVILFFGGKYIALLFMDADQTEIIGRVAMFLIGNSMFYIPLTFVNVVRFTIQGMGFSTFAILAGVCEMAARSLVGFCLVPVFGFLPACFASPLAWIFADAFLIPAFFHCMKKLKVLFGEAA